MKTKFFAIIAVCASLVVFTILRAPLEEARRLGHIPVNPAQAVKPLRDTAARNREAFTTGQIGALLRSSEGTDWQGCILFGAFCGLRLKDAANGQPPLVGQIRVRVPLLNVIQKYTRKGLFSKIFSLQHPFGYSI